PQQYPSRAWIKGRNGHTTEMSNKLTRIAGLGLAALVGPALLQAIAADEVIAEFYTAQRPTSNCEQWRRGPDVACKGTFVIYIVRKPRGFELTATVSCEAMNGAQSLGSNRSETWLPPRFTEHAGSMWITSADYNAVTDIRCHVVDARR